jgi:anti-anti-sigma regulatory factor
VLCSLNDTIKNLFKLTRMDRIFSIKETRQDALNRSLSDDVGAGRGLWIARFILR